MSEPASRVARRMPELLIGIGVVHVAATPFLQPGLRPLVSDGVLNAVGDDPSRESAVWFAVTGLACIGLGDVARTAVREDGELPRRFGAWVLATGAVISATMPVSPGWLVMGIGAAALLPGSSRQTVSRRPLARRPRPGARLWHLRDRVGVAR